MALRFRKSIRLAPGLRINLTQRGVGLSVGQPGSSLSFGSQGTHLNIGIPGTGLHSRTRISGSQKKRRSSSRYSEHNMRIAVDDEGRVLYTFEDGSSLPPEFIAQTKIKLSRSIKQLVKDSCNDLNTKQDILIQLHHSTPAPKPPQYTPIPFNKPPPQKPKTRKFWLFLLGRVDRIRKIIEEKNATSLQHYKNALRQWEDSKNAHDTEQEETRKLIEEKIWTDQNVMESTLEKALQNISWPRETLVEFEIKNEGEEVWLDVDLPEIEDMPTKIAKVTERGFEIAFEHLSETKVRTLYMRHIHSIGLRLIGEIFATLPKCNLIVLSSYSQRNDPITGDTLNHYLYSVKADRSSWEKINFNNLPTLDPVASFENFECKREVSKTGLFKPIAPFSSDGTL